MLSKYELALIEYFGQLSARSLVFGLDWDDQNKLLHVSKLKTKRFANSVLLVAAVMMLVNSVSRLHAIFVTKTEIVRIELQVVYIFILTPFIAASMLHHSFSYRKPELAVLYNLMLMYSR